MGVAIPRQTIRDVVILTAHRSLIWVNVPNRCVRRAMYSVRIEGVRGSNPLSSTQRSSRFTWHYLHVYR